MYVWVHVMPDAKQQSSTPMRNKNANWLYWWRVDRDAVKRQIQEYRTLSFFKTYKALSVFVLLLSALIISSLVFLHVNKLDSFLDALVLTVLSILIARGNLNAIIFAMIFWTAARAWNLYQACLQPEISPGLILLIFAWWSVCMHAFYMAYCVEREYQATQSPSHPDKFYEQYFFYRLTKVLFVIFLILGILFSCGFSFALRPSLYLDYDSSFIACDNGKYYGLTPLRLQLLAGEHDLDAVSDSVARKMCEYGTATDTSHYRYETPESKNYTLGLSYQKEGSWLAVIVALSLCLSGLLFTLFLLREMLLYLVLGKPFSWPWMKG